MEFLPTLSQVTQHLPSAWGGSPSYGAPTWGSCACERGCDRQGRGAPNLPSHGPGTGSCCCWPRLRKQAGANSSPSGSLEQTSWLLRWRRQWRRVPTWRRVPEQPVRGARVRRDPASPLVGSQFWDSSNQLPPHIQQMQTMQSTSGGYVFKWETALPHNSSPPRSMGHVNLFAPNFEPYCCKYLNMKSWLTTATYKGDLFHIRSSEIFFWTI